MENKIVLLDTSILIEFFRKTDKTKTTLFTLADRDYSFCISAITEFEIYTGATIDQQNYWEEFLQRIIVHPFDAKAVKIAVSINNQLKRKRKQLDMADLFIGAIALSQGLPIATLNKKHFKRIDNLQLIN